MRKRCEFYGVKDTPPQHKSCPSTTSRSNLTSTVNQIVHEVSTMQLRLTIFEEQKGYSSSLNENIEEVLSNSESEECNKVSKKIWNSHGKEFLYNK